MSKLNRVRTIAKVQLQSIKEEIDKEVEAIGNARVLSKNT